MTRCIGKTIQRSVIKAQVSQLIDRGGATSRSTCQRPNIDGISVVGYDPVGSSRDAVNCPRGFGDNVFRRVASRTKFKD
jgi:hypothetical protein